MNSFALAEVTPLGVNLSSIGTTCDGEKVVQGLEYAKQSKVSDCWITNCKEECETYSVGSNTHFSFISAHCEIGLPFHFIPQRCQLRLETLCRVNGKSGSVVGSRVNGACDMPRTILSWRLSG